MLYVVVAALTLAQIPGQYPPGQTIPNTGPYPGGSYPGGGMGIPGGGGPGAGTGIPRFPRKTKKGQPTEQQMRDYFNLHGNLRKLDAKSVFIETEDKVIVQAIRDAELTKLIKGGEEAKSSDFQPGDHIVIEAAKNDDNRYVALSINWQKAGTEQDKLAASRPLPEDIRFEDDYKPEKAKADDERPRLARKGDPAPVKKTEEAKPKEPAPKAAAPPPPVEEEPEAKATVVSDADAVGRIEAPKIRRGRPASTRQNKDLEEAPERVQIASAAATTSPRAPLPIEEPTAVVTTDPTTVEDPLIERAREAALNFSEVLPNYLAKQMTTRFQGDSKGRRWQPMDNYVADVVYEDGKESYRNVMLNGKAAKGKVEESGAYSRGEFGTIVGGLFHPGTAAVFKPRGNVTIVNRKAKLYDFKVEQERSQWRVGLPGQNYYPAYRGSLWIDIETARVLRLEMQGVKMPQSFPIDTVETALDFDFVKIGGGNYLVPVHSEILSCFRTEGVCSKNVIDFRNYRKFGAQSDIVIGQ